MDLNPTNRITQADHLSIPPATYNPRPDSAASGLQTPRLERGQQQELRESNNSNIRLNDTISTSTKLKIAGALIGVSLAAAGITALAIYIDRFVDNTVQNAKGLGSGIF